MATTRLDIRLDEKIKAKAERATALLGLKSLTEYITVLMDENATQVISEHEGIAVQQDVFEEFMNACNASETPNKALIDAAAFTKRANFN